MTDSDLAALTKSELHELFLMVDKRLHEFMDGPKLIYRHDPEYIQTERHLFAIVKELSRRNTRL